MNDQVWKRGPLNTCANNHVLQGAIGKATAVWREHTWAAVTRRMAFLEGSCGEESGAG